MNTAASDIIVNGIVISTMEVGEADKRIVLLTKQLGKITAFAYGAKRQNSPLLAASNPFVCGEFTLTRSKGAYRLHRVKVDNYFRELMEDYDKSCYGFYFLEFASFFAVENVGAIDYLNLLYQSFRALLNNNIPDTLIRYVFELKMFALNGEAPAVYECCLCKKKVEEGYFSIKRKCIVHRYCGNERNIPLSRSAIYTLQYVISSKLSNLYSFNVSDDVYLQIKKMMDEYRKNMINYSFKSEKFLPG